MRMIETMGKTVKLQIWDTAGQERFRCPVEQSPAAAGITFNVLRLTARSLTVETGQ